MNAPNQNQNSAPNKGHPQQEQGQPNKERQPGSETADASKQAESTQQDRPADDKQGQAS